MTKEEMEIIINSELERLGYDIEGSKTADFTDGFVRGFKYHQEQVKAGVTSEKPNGSYYIECDKCKELVHARLSICSECGNKNPQR